MNSWQAFWAGIAPQHVPALLAALALPVLVLIGRRFGVSMRPVPGVPRRLYPVPRLAAWLLGIAAAVHLALPLGHFDGVVLALLFLADGAGFAWLAMRVVEGRPWRLLSALLLSATLIAYLVVVGSGREQPDQVGIATALVELAALGLCLVPSRQPGRPRRFARFAASTATVVVTLLVGTAIWASAFLSRTPAPAGSTVDSAAVHEHGHDSAARAQAGVIMRLLADPHPTAADQAGADRLAAATIQATQRFQNLQVALAAGYKLPVIPRGLDVHLENPAYKKDGRVLDPSRPEMLVYAIDDRGATLLGVVFVMERAGVPGPTPGGPITRWHAHNLCLTALPPGYGVVSPFGSCPALSIDVTSPEMMHVWVVPDPAGPFADGLDKTWEAAYHDTHVTPFA
jgi:hypothetical protein